MSSLIGDHARQETPPEPAGFVSALDALVAVRA